MKQDGVLDGPQDPEAEFCAAIIHIFGASYGCRAPQACPPPSPSAFPGTIAYYEEQNLAWTDHFAGRQSLANKNMDSPEAQPILDKLFSP